MAERTAKRIAELLLEDHKGETSFDVDFLDGPFTELLVKALKDLGCIVERANQDTRLRVSPPGR